MVEIAEERVGSGRPPLDKILHVEPLGDDTFEGRSYSAGPDEAPGRIYGGQAIAQALLAAGRTVSDDRVVHSLHAHFLHAGDTATPVAYRVERARDGRSFTTRHVTAEQNGSDIFELTASFQRPETGLSHQPPAPEAPAPEDLPDMMSVVTEEQKAAVDWLRNFHRNIAIDFRIPGDNYPRLATRGNTAREPHQLAWVKTSAPLPDDPLIHAAAWGYISDMFLLSTALLPHSVPIDANRTQVASLDHAVWFHADFRPDEWHLYEQVGIWTGGGRGLSRGHLYDRAGRLVASTMQEGLLRVR
jgi:acyl-CoA thioesterase II